MNSSTKLTPSALAARSSEFEAPEGQYDWHLQRRNYGRNTPMAYKMSTQTFGPSGQPKDSDKDYDK